MVPSAGPGLWGVARVQGPRFRVLTLVAVMFVPLVASCGNPTQSVQNCVGASDSVLSAIQQKMKPDADANPPQRENGAGTG